MTTAIGIDVSEKRIVGGVVHLENGDALCRREIPVDASRDGAAVLADVLRAVEEWYDEGCAHFAHPTAIGLCICEDVDRAGEIVSGRRVAWCGLPVHRLLTQIAPAHVETRVRAYARAEARFGAGRGESSFVFADAESTIRACLVMDGRPYAGFDGNAVLSGELPCTAIDARGRRVRFVLDDFASVDAVVRRCRVEKLDAAFDLVLHGDAAASEVLQTAGESLGAALGHLCSALDPQSVVIGGEFGDAPSVYWEALGSAVRAHTRNATSRRLVVHRALLRANAGIVGAALAAAEGAAGGD